MTKRIVRDAAPVALPTFLFERERTNLGLVLSCLIGCSGSRTQLVGKAYTMVSGGIFGQSEEIVKTICSFTELLGLGGEEP